MLNTNYQTELINNRACFLKILQNLQILARQGIGLRGGESEENSNFYQLAVLQAIDVPSIKEWLKKKSLLKYKTSV